MSRVRVPIQVNGRECWALFDTGALNSYIVADAVGTLPRWRLPKPEPVALGGKAHQIEEECWLICTVEGYHVRARARIVNDIGKDEDDRRIEVLMGALAMEEWRIRPIPDEGRLDMSHYPKEFVEF